MKGPTIRRCAKGSTRPTSNPPRSRRRWSMTRSSMSLLSWHLGGYRAGSAGVKQATVRILRQCAQHHRVTKWELGQLLPGHEIDDVPAGSQDARVPGASLRRRFGTAQFIGDDV